MIKQEPAAWLVFADDGSESSAVYMTEEEAQAAVDAWGWRMTPLYTMPTLTDAERLAIQWVVGEALSVDGVSIQDTLRGLLEKTK